MMDQFATRPARPHISSRDVTGTAVYSPSGEKLGHIEELIIDKLSGRIAYAEMGFGGFLGLGEEYHPIPWSKLSYDVELDGFVTDITKEQLDAAPKRTEDWRTDRRWEQDYFTYYGAVPYW
ncbi:PRC-barrel domain-containing protein [Frigidibacter sp. MR17.14]|uniref:PRC-barrel domain-containing protein n=1 Tax=Frigidibacter sp. MR17.14 TaxID=3126509 RepID=UPI003013180F